MAKDICYSDLLLLTNDIEENVDQLISHGADNVEILMDGIKWNLMEEVFDSIAIKLKEKPIGYSVHPPAWDINLTSENKAIRESSYNEYIKAIQFAEKIGAVHVVIHPGFIFSPVFDRKLAQKRAADYINRLCKIAKPLGVKLGIENVGYNGSSIFTEKEFLHFLDDIDETAGYLIDTGHAHLNNWNIPSMIEQVSDRLLALHLHDNSGKADEHLPIGEGTIEWDSIFRSILSNNNESQLILEYAPGTDLKKLLKGKELLLAKTSKLSSTYN